MLIQPKLSVILPTYNRAHYILEAIASVLSQGIEGVEIIVVDDGSTDNTPELIRALQDSRIRYIYQSNQGLACARNKGLDEAYGQYVSFLDSDDVWLPGRIKAQLSFLETHPEVDLVYGPHYEGDSALRPMELTSMPHTLRFEDWLSGCRFSIIDVTVRRASLDDDVRNNPRLSSAEDWDFWLRFFYKENKAAFLGQPTGIVRHHHSNKTAYIHQMTESVRAMVHEWQTERGVIFPATLMSDVHYSNARMALRRGNVSAALDELEEAITTDPSPGAEAKDRAEFHVVSLAADPFCTDPQDMIHAASTRVETLIGPLSTPTCYMEAKAYLLRARDALMTSRDGDVADALRQAYRLHPLSFGSSLPIFLDAAVTVAETQDERAGEDVLNLLFSLWPARTSAEARLHKTYLGQYHLNLGLYHHQLGRPQKARAHMRLAVQYAPMLMGNRGLLSVLSGWASRRRAQHLTT